MNQRKGKQFLLQMIGLVMTGSMIMGYFPIGVAYFASLFGMNGGRVLSVILYLAGMLYHMNFLQIMKYACALMVVVCAISLFEYGTKEKNHYLYALFAGLSITIMELADTVMQNFSWQEVAMEVAVGVLTFALTAIFSVGMNGILNHNVHTDFSGEEIISMASIVGISLFFISGKTTLPFALTQTIIYTTILVLGYKYGVGMGAVTGTACGIVWGIATGNLEMIGFLGILGIFAGAFRELGRLVSILAMLFGSLMLGFNYCPLLLQEQWIQGLFVSGIIFLLLPSGIIFVYHAKRPEQEESEPIVETQNKVGHIAELFEKMSGTFWEAPGQAMDVNSFEINQILNETYMEMLEKQNGQLMESSATREAEETQERNTTTNIMSDDMQWGEVVQDATEVQKTNLQNRMLSETQLQNIRKMAARIRRKGCLEEEDLTPQFIEECQDMNEFLMQVNHKIDKARLQKLWQNKLQDSREAVALQMFEISKILQSCTSEEYIMIPVEKERETYIRKKFKSNKMLVKRVTMLENRRHNREVVVTLQAERGNCITTKEAAEVLGECLGMQMRPAAGSRNVIGQEEISVTFREETKFHTLYGCVKKVKESNRVSGDNFMVSQLENGQLFMGISDGMGSGLSANHDSSMVMELLGQMLECGFEVEAALKLINSVLMMNAKAPGPTTLDMGVIDLYSGMCDFVKMGAASTFIKRGSWVEVMKSTSMPMGVLGQVDLDSASKKLYDGDYVIMVSDGIVEALEAGNKEYAMSTIIQDIHLKNPKEMAREIMRKAMEHADNVPTDDMTVLVTGIWSKSAA